MLKNLSFYLLLTLFSIANQTLYAQSLIATINVTSGVDNTGAYLGEGLVDPNWVIADSPDYPGSPVPAITCPYIAGYWVPTPMPVTNAGWLNATAVLGTQTPGFYSFERTFTVPAGTDIMSLNFNLAADDTLTALVLVPPTGPDIPLTVAFTVPNQYYPSTLPVPGNIVSPVAGTWKIRPGPKTNHRKTCRTRHRNMSALGNKDSYCGVVSSSRYNKFACVAQW